MSRDAVSKAIATNERAPEKNKKIYRLLKLMLELIESYMQQAKM